MAVVAICIGTAWLSSLAGLSVALGAFLGGMVVADTEYSHRAMGDVLPLRDIFVSLFSSLWVCSSIPMFWLNTRKK